MPLTTIQSGMMDSVAQYYGFKNRIINGAMVIDQRNAGASITPSGAFPGFAVDRTSIIVSQNSKLTAQQNAGSVTPPVGFTNYLGVTSSSAYSVLAGDYFFISQAIEGFNVADFGWGSANAQTVTVSFWVRSSLAGTHSGSIRNNAVNRSYVFTFSISSANTWEYKTITIPGDTSGTWLTNNSVGIYLALNLGAGSTFSAASGSWGAGNFVGATGAVSVVGTNGATFYITGVQLEKGSTATSFDYRPYGTELALCQRYYYQSWGSGSMALQGNAYVGLPVVGVLSASIGTTTFPVTMRATPTITLYDDVGNSGSVSQPGVANSLVSTASSISTNGFSTVTRTVGSYSSGYNVRGHFISAIEL